MFKKILQNSAAFTTVPYKQNFIIDTIQNLEIITRDHSVSLTDVLKIFSNHQINSSNIESFKLNRTERGQIFAVKLTVEYQKFCLILDDLKRSYDEIIVHEEEQVYQKCPVQNFRNAKYEKYNPFHHTNDKNFLSYSVQPFYKYKKKILSNFNIINYKVIIHYSQFIQMNQYASQGMSINYQLFPFIIFTFQKIILYGEQRMTQLLFDQFAG